MKPKYEVWIVEIKRKNKWYLCSEFRTKRAAIFTEEGYAWSHKRYLESNDLSAEKGEDIGRHARQV